MKAVDMYTRDFILTTDRHNSILPTKATTNYYFTSFQLQITLKQNVK